MAPPICPACAHEEYNSLENHFDIVVIGRRVRFVLCNDHGGAMFRLVFIKDEVIFS